MRKRTSVSPLARITIAVWVLAIAAASSPRTAAAQPLPPSQSMQRMAQSTMHRWPDGRFVAANQPWHWNYELGTLLMGMDAAWYNSADGDYYRYIKSSVDQFVQPDGSISTYKPEEYQLDSILLGRQLLLLCEVTQDKRYYKAATLLRDQLSHQPKNASGGFWHKQIYPNQMWLDGIYMAEPFLAQYADDFQQPQDFAQITHQFTLIYQHTRDPKTGLLYHGWDESKQKVWANPTTGASPDFWSRAIGWYMMALVDTIPLYPENDPGRAQLLAILQRLTPAILRVQDPGTGLWYQVPDKPGAKGNYFESSAACMFTYVLAKGVRLGYLPAADKAAAERAWHGIQTHFLQTDPDGSLTLTGTVKGVGLGNIKSVADAYTYYVTTPVISNDSKGIGACLLAASEMEMAPHASEARGKTVLLDAWYNSQHRKNAAGQMELFHYKWNDYANSGNSLFGHILRSYGVKTETLTSAPDLNNLRKSQFYLIVSPDNTAKNPNPHYMNEADAARISAWVRQGGTLLMMENDPANADITHFDILADKFGLHFNNVLVHHVIDDDFAMGRIDLPSPAPPFTHPHVLYMKDTCSLALSGKAQPLLHYKGDLLMAWTRYGKGMVVAVTDPWLYNEYTDGRKLPPEYDNFAGGQDFVAWLLHQQAQLPH
ncbi:MAG TPA: glycoside hydrolase family 88 protein [Acidobacteriaceae bacterium]|jgi:unsaturated rhamnogalacturonyl hydrolase|nr:glycoside hydrolase family 88 protein [Acidobacteriaceae bacterium]